MFSGQSKSNTFHRQEDVTFLRKPQPPRQWWDVTQYLLHKTVNTVPSQTFNHKIVIKYVRRNQLSVGSL